MKKKIVSLLLAASMLSMAATGCGNNAGNETETAAVETSEEAPAEDTAETEENVDAAESTEAEEATEADETADAEESADATGEKVLRAGATSGWFGAETLDVANGWDGWIMSIYGISENLLRLNEEYVPQPYIAESYEQVDDTTWKFVIRDGVTFSNGNPVTAEAVKACFERTYANNERAEGTLGIASIEADGQELTIVTKDPNPTMLNDLCDPLLGIYDASAEPDAELGVACTGPFVATSFTSMDHVDMVKNENYWGSEPKLDRVELKIVDDMNTLAMALQNGDIDMIARMDAAETEMFSDASEYTIDAATSTRSAFLVYNLQHEGINDPAVREAIGWCVDRESFADVVYNGYSEASYGVYSTAVPFGGTDGLTLTIDKFDPEKAKEILADAGYEDTNGDGTLDKDGNELSFKLMTYSYNNETLQLADMMQAELANVGIGINIETMDVMVETEQDGDFDIVIDSYAMAPIGTPQYFTNLVFVSDASDNFGKYSNAKVDEMAKKMSTTFDVNEQYDLSRQICQEIVNERPFDFIASTKLIFCYRNNVSGVTVNPSEYYMMTSDIDVN
ncbi:ABC transporter substrate-binding protein [Butyrivibrio sp. WCD3002]|uniref:ABC transporter substrate-binding protein n=1 Tax=Butyrivibrio sp. WCD3002 TaxID=1280676 RepID=UPI0003FD052F|nr:ABC transporter substrate-binding protein [Butyrivibrio sp. WCD3002]